MLRLNPVAKHRGWAMLDAVMALVLWASAGTGLMLQTRAVIQLQTMAWREALATEWQADLFERLHLAHLQAPVQLDWGQKLIASSCIDADCASDQWRDSLIADWQARLLRDLPQAQSLLMAWPEDPRLQIVGLRWPDPTANEQNLPMNLVCPAGWHCLLALGWP